MKRRVRIYKAGGQHGSYINKTAQYFQEGGMQVQEEVAPEEQPAQEPSDEQVITFIMQTLSQPNGSIEQAKQQLVQANINPARITQLSEAALDYINQQQDIALAEETGNEEDAAAMQLEQDANDRAVAEEEQAAQQVAQNQEMYAQSEESAVDPNENDDSSAAYMRSGGMPNKRAYISNFIKLAKKQEGGDTEESKSDIKTDIPVGGRVEKVSKFHNALKSTANNVALKEQAEKQYEQQMQQMQQMPPQGYAQDGGDTESGVSDFDPYHNLEHYSGAFEHSMPFNALTEAQFGGWGHGRERRAARRMNRMMPQGFNQIGNMMGNQMINPFMQQQMNPLAQFMPNQGNLGLANIDVHRMGMFGRPKEYTINFNQQANPNAKPDVVPQEVTTNNVNGEKVTAETVAAEEVTTPVVAEEVTTPVVAEEVVTETTLPTVDEIEIVGTSSGKGSTSKGTSKPPIRTDLKSGRYEDTKGNLHIRHVSADGKVYNKIMPAGTFTKKPMSHWESFKEDPLKWMGYQQGGFTDEESGLTRFTGGGEDFSQYDLDYSDSKNISSPYFQSGGYFQIAGQTDNSVVDILDASGNVVRKGTLAEAERAGLNHRIAPTTNTSTTTNQSNFSAGDGMGGPDYAQQYLQYLQYLQNQNQGSGLGANNPFSFITRGANWNKAVGKPYGTINPISGMIGPNAQVSSIDVHKTRRFGPNKGDAKKFTVNYNVPGQLGINASGTPQSYKGSDGQTHWLGSDQGTRGIIGTANKPESRAQSMYRRLTEKNFAPTEQSTTGFHDKGDEAYKKQFGHYPGEDTVDPKLAAQLKFVPPTQEQLENESYNTPSNIDSDISMRTKSNMYSPEAIPRETYMQDQEIVPNQFNADPNYQARQEPLPLEQGQEGSSTEEDAIYNEQFNQQRNQDLAGFGAGLLGVPNEQDLYNQSQGDVSAQEAQNFELQKMYDQSQQYPELGDLESLDYTQQVGPQAIPEQQIPVQQQTQPVSRPGNNQRRNAIPIVKQNTTPVINNNRRNTSENWVEVATKNMSRQQKADFQKREGDSFIELQTIKDKVVGNYPEEYRKFAPKIDPVKARQFNKLSPTEKLNFINKLRNSNDPLFDGYINILQKGGTLPKAQFGPPEDVPFGYFKDPTSGLYKNLAGDIHAPKTNLQGNADKLMSNNDLALNKDYTNPFTGESPGIKMGEDGQYQNDGLLSDEEKQAGASQQMSQKFKNKQEWNIDATGALDAFNTAGNWAAGAINQWGDARQNRNQGNKYNADQLYATTNEKDRGDWDQEGRFRLDQEGDNGLRLGREGGSPQNIETWMSEEQIQQFLAEGGELEFV